ncbi:hypothetical protein OC00_05445 [Xanthomonas vasicola]|nr:hypothetical protein NX07_12130 [Xanthomonas vasicola]KGR54254.1 hypothetical protein NX09_13140 [Xanthomonas vasicola]KGT84974.1 hypothetical protein OC00_05445 [Xanthomonas vasicola]
MEVLDRPSIKLRKVAMASTFFDLDEERKQVVWLRRWRERTVWFLIEVAACFLGYISFASVGTILVLISRKKALPDGVPLTMAGAIIFFMACTAFWHVISLVQARSTLKFVNGASRPKIFKIIKRRISTFAHLFNCGSSLINWSKFIRRPPRAEQGSQEDVPK